MDRFEQQQDEEDEQVVTRRSKLAKYEIAEKEKKKKPNVNIVISAILISVSVIGILMVNGNIVYDVDSGKIDIQTRGNSRVDVTTVVNTIENPADPAASSDPSANPNAGGNTIVPQPPGMSPNTGVLSVSADAHKIVEALKLPEYNLNSNFMQYVDAYGVLFDKLKAAGASDAFAIGVIANCTSEGTPAMRQGTYTILSNQADFQNAVDASSTGIGFGQWTYRPYKRYLIAQYNNSGIWSDFTIEKATNIEADYVCAEAFTSVDYSPYGGGSGGNAYAACNSAVISSGLASSENAITAAQYAEAWCDAFEKPGGSCVNAGSAAMTCLKTGGGGSACKTRSDRANIIVNYLNGG